MTPGEEAFWTLAWPHGQLTVRAIGAMLAPLHFELGGGQRISPLYVAPWVGEGGIAQLSGLMRGLRGEWPCLPFGPAEAPAGLPPGWIPHPAESPWDHGHAANHPWTLIDRSETSLTLRIELPAHEPVAAMQRHIRVTPDAPEVSVEWTVQPRRDAVVPIALHPTFAVPPSGVQLIPGPFTAVHTYPRPPELDGSRLKPGQQAASLAALACDDGTTLDLRRLPLSVATEELLQLQDCGPPFVLRYADGTEVELDWDREHLPDVMLWVSQRGRRQAPWNGRNQALGIEPCHSCFDLSRVADPPGDHPLAHRRGLEMRAGMPVRMSYRIRAWSPASAANRAAAAQ